MTLHAFIFNSNCAVSTLHVLTSRLRRYCAKSVSWEVQVATAFGWLTAMTIVAIVPLDTYATLNHRPIDVISIMWSIVFW